MKKKLILLISIFFISINLVYANDTVKFSSCVDGDTFKVTLDGKIYTVRMLAVDTPESVHPTKKIEYYGKESSEYTCNKVTNAKKIKLEYDQNSDKMDKYDRLLAWVFIDDVLLQEELVENGYAKLAYLYDDYKYTDSLEQKQELASIKEIGVWNETAKADYNEKNNIDTDDENTADDTKENKSYTTKEIIIIVLLLLVIIFIGDKTIKNKAKKKLKTYLK